MSDNKICPDCLKQIATEDDFDVIHEGLGDSFCWRPYYLDTCQYPLNWGVLVGKLKEQLVDAQNRIDWALEAIHDQSLPDGGCRFAVLHALTPKKPLSKEAKEWAMGVLERLEGEGEAAE